MQSLPGVGSITCMFLVFVLALGGAASATADVAETRVQHGDYDVRIIQLGEFSESYLEIYQGEELVWRQSGWRFWIGQSPEDLFLSPEQVPTLTIGEDITGNGLPDLVVREWTGGAHCCIYFYVFELGSELRSLGTLGGGHDDGSHFADITEDGAMEFLTHDWTFAYWRTDFASSPAPAVVLHYDGNAYAVADHLMRRPPPSADDVLARGLAIQSALMENPDLDWVEPFWGDLLELIYSGQAPMAWQLLELAWPPLLPGKADFTADFWKTLSRSPYLYGLVRLNDGELAPPSISGRSPE